MRKKPTRWTEKETEMLIELYPNSVMRVFEIARQIGRTQSSVYAKASRMKLRRASLRLRRRGKKCKKLSDF
jgi:hypothetical protein